LRITKLILVAMAAAGLAACHRQQNIHVVYVPSPPPARSAATGQSGVMVIQRPAPAQPAAAAHKPEQPPQPIETHAAVTPAPVARKEAPAPAPPTATQPSGDAPQIEPARTLQQQVVLEVQIRTLQDSLRQRMGSLRRHALSPADQKTIEDARMLLVQSSEAMKTGDLLQSLNLAQKADTLVAAVEKQY
jgi:hypothetical protein